MASRSWNRIELIGNLTRDPELRYIPSGTAVATFGLATNRVYVTEGERKEEVDFHRIVAWGKLAELCNQLLKKGAKVFISGRLQYREWESQDGQKRRDAEIVLEDMILITPKNSGDYESVPEEVKESRLPKTEPGDGGQAQSHRVKESEELKVEEPKSEETEEKKVKEENAPVIPKVDESVDEDLPF